MNSNDNMPAEPAKGSLGAKALAAFAFSSMGAKLGTVAMIVDANALYHQGTSFGSKLKGVFNGTLFRTLRSEVHTLRQQGHGWLYAYFKPFKWSTVVGTPAMIITGVVGWMRGGLIGDWKDIFKHPIRATKIILGFTPPGDDPIGVPPVRYAPATVAAPAARTNHAEQIRQAQCETPAFEL